jgi:hypothetical protein
MGLPVQPTFPAGLISPSASQASGIPTSLGSLLFNAVDSSGVAWVLYDLDGWDGTAEAELSFIKRPRAYGALASAATDRQRVMVAKGMVEVPAANQLQAAMQQLNAAASLDETILGVNESGLIRHMTVQRQDKVIWTRINATQAEFNFQIVAEDPRKYGNLVTLSTGLPSVSGGRTYPATYPITYTGTMTSGIIQVNNAGDAVAPVWFKAEGVIPAGGWSISHAGKKKNLTFATSLALGADEFVTIDMDSREIRAQGQSARSGWVTQRGWFDLDPGTNEIAFSAVNFDPTAKLTAYTMSAWS